MNKFKRLPKPAFFAAILLVVGVFVLTRNPITGPFKLQLTLLSLLALLAYGYLLKRRGSVPGGMHGLLFLGTASVLLLVGSTGWFFSPFFFALYLLAIFLAFAYDMWVCFGLVATLVALFSFNIGEVDLTYDFLVVLSLVATIPLSMFLRREYLRLRETEKEILILTKEKDHYQNKVEEVLANTVSNMAVNLRQPINDVRQIAYHQHEVKEKQKLEENRQKIIAASEEALRMLKEFEEEVTGANLLTNAEIPLRRLPVDRG